MADSIRTCVGCRRTDRREALVRVARAAAGITVDVRGRVPGRGAWLHQDPTCWSGARGGLARTLRASVTERDLARVIATLETLSDPARAQLGATSSDSGLLRRNAVDIATRSKAQD
jgi:predicted RNA-binding protein YlxR (DUF448 family)